MNRKVQYWVELSQISIFEKTSATQEAEEINSQKNIEIK